MAQQLINVGSSGNDGTGDPARVAGQKINANFTELYGLVAAAAQTGGAAVRVIELDDVSPGFNGASRTFALRRGGQNLPAADGRFLIVTFNGLVQHPSTYTLAGTAPLQITFATAPRAGLTCSIAYFEVVQGSTGGGGGGGGGGSQPTPGPTCTPVFHQPTAPTAGDNPCSGSVWFDTDDGKIYTWSGSAWVAFNPDVPQAVEIVDTLPATGNYEGRIVLLRPDGKLYIFRTGSWAALVANVTAADITAGLYSNGLRPVEIVSALPVIGNVEGRMAYLTTNGQLYIFTAGAWKLLSNHLTPNAPTGIEVVSANPTTGNFEGRVIFNTTLNQLLKFTNGVYVQVVQPTGAAQEVADGSITTAKFAQGIAPVEIVATLPSTGNFEGRLVYLTADDKLYRFTGSAFIASVAAGDVTGQLTSSQLGAGSVTSTALAANAVVAGKIAAGAISAAEIAAGAISADKLAAGSVTAEKIASLAVTAEKIAANAVTANALAVNSVTAGKIQAGAIGATQIAASAITGDKIAANTITGANIQAGTIAASNIASGAITTAKLEAGAVTSSVLAADSVTAGKVAAGAIGASQISVSSLGAITANLGTVTAGSVTGVTITGATIQTAASGFRTYLSGGEAALRTKDPSFSSRTYYRSGSWPGPNAAPPEQDLIILLAGDSGGSQPARFITYSGGIGLGVYALGNLSNPASLPGNAAVQGHADHVGVRGYSNYAGVQGLAPTMGVNGWGESGGHDFYASGNGANYGPFTGSHDALIRKSDALELGDLVVDVEVVRKANLSNALLRVERSGAANQKGVVGVVISRRSLDPTIPPAAIMDRESEAHGILPAYAGLVDEMDRLSVNAVGEGLVNVCGEGGSIAVGDLLVASSMPGKAMRQADDVVRSATVARAREAVTLAPGETAQIACIYLCG